MATTTLVLDNELLSSTGLKWIQKLRQSKDKPYVATEHALANVETQDGGHRVVIPWETEDHSNPTRIQNGYESLDNAARPTMTPGTERWAQIAQPVFISRRDRAQNRGEEQQVKIWESRIENVRRHIHRVLEEVMFRGPAASGSWTGHAAYLDFLTLNGDDSTTGLIEGQASGTNTLHGLAKASYPATDSNSQPLHRQFHNVWYDGAGSFAANGLNGLWNMIVNSIVKNGPINASRYKGYISAAVAEYLKRALRAKEQYVSENSGDMDDGGRTVFKYHGIPLTITDRLPNNGATTNTDPWSAVFVDWEDGINLIGMKDYVMAFDDVEMIPLTLVQAACFHLMAQFTGPQPGRCALLTDAEAW